MPSLGFHKVFLNKISVPERLRAVSNDHVATIVESVQQCGEILSPIILGTQSNVLGEDPDSLEFFLIAGAHRLAAAAQVGLERIPAQVWENIKPEEARLIEIDENLVRHELNPLDRAVFLFERKNIYEILHPEAKKGAKNQHTVGLLSDTVSFSQDAAEKTKLSKRTIERACQIAEGIPEELRLEIANTNLALNQGELLKLAKIGDPTVQKEIIALLNDGAVKKVEEGLKAASGHVERTMDPNEEALTKMVDHWNRLPKAVQDDFLDILVDTGRVAFPTQAEAAE